MSDYRVIIKIKNNLLHELMRRKGIATQSELARATGASPAEIGKVANLKIGAFGINGRPSSVTRRLCDYFGCLPEDIYPREVLHVGIPRNVVERVVASEEVAKYLEQDAADPMLAAEAESNMGFVLRNINRLTAREKQVIEQRYIAGLTYAEIGRSLDIVPQSAKQIETKALNKLKKYCGDEMRECDLRNRTTMPVKVDDRAIVRLIDKTPEEGDDIGVFLNGNLLKTFNSVSDYQAYSKAEDFKAHVNEFITKREDGTMDPKLKAEVRSTGHNPRKKDDVGVYIGDTLLRSFNSLSSDYAYSNAREYANMINRRKI